MVRMHIVVRPEDFVYHRTPLEAADILPSPQVGRDGADCTPPPPIFLLLWQMSRHVGSSTRAGLHVEIQAGSGVTVRLGVLIKDSDCSTFPAWSRSGTSCKEYEMPGGEIAIHSLVIALMFDRMRKS